ncbi:YadA-like family protein [Synechococcus sp. MIT S9503]|uniref:YadA-like family protein n=1 Tax=Synechococcus sp. MIT S9503 TaxID=3082547 RepID=UPI0039A50513
MPRSNKIAKFALPPLSILALSLLTPITSRAQEIIPGSNNLGFFVTGTNTGTRTRLDLYKMNTSGVATELHADIFPDNDLSTFSASDYTVNTKTGKIYFLEAPTGSASRRVRIWDIKTEKFEGYTNIEGLPSGGSPMFIEYPTFLNEIVKKSCVSSTDSCADNDTTKVTFGAEGSDSVAIIDDDGLSVGGRSIVRRKINAAGEEELHIGENSLVQVESDGELKLYANDINGQRAPINITGGSDLQINGVSVQGQIDTNVKNINNNSAAINVNSSAINKNSKKIDALEDNVNDLGFGVAGATALSTAMSALPTVAQDSPLSCGVGTGGYSSRFAMSVGCAVKANDRLSINAGGSYVFGGAAEYGNGSLSNAAARAGFVFKFGNLDTPAASNEQLQSQLDEVQEENASIKEQNQELLARLERLEAIALDNKPSAKTASLK